MSKSILISHLNHFIQFCAKELNMDVPPIKFAGGEHDKLLSFGHTIGKKIQVRITNRHPMDVMRTIAHEMYHAKLNNKTSSQQEEDKANVIAGRIMRKYNERFPQVFKSKPINENEGVAANAMAGGENIATFDPLMGKKKKLKKILKREK